MPSVLTIAGSDSGGGAGIQADLKTYAALGVYGTCAVTAVTAQNTMGVTAVHEVPPEIVAAQIDAVVTDIRPDAVKTGMLSSAAIVEVVAAKVKEHGLPHLVIDPVMVSKSGVRLLREDAVRAVRDLLLPLAEVVTPNLPEVEALTDRSLATDDEIRLAARHIGAMGVRNVVVTGGHLLAGRQAGPGDAAVDLLWDGREFHAYSARRIETASTHGTGCTFASAIAAYLALGEPVAEAVGRAKGYLTEAIRRAYPIGNGNGPVHHFHRWWPGPDG